MHSSLAVPQILTLQTLGGLSRQCKLTAACLCRLVCIVILTLLNPVVIQCGIMKIKSKRVVVFEEYLLLL